MNKNLKQQIKLHASENPDQECCGIVYLDKNQSVCSVRSKNIHPDPCNFFEIPIEDIQFIKDNFSILATYHSHPRDCSSPSDFDVLNAEELCLPYYIYSLADDDFNLYRPISSFNKEIIGRHFAEDTQNCLTCVFDYLFKNYGLKNIKEGDVRFNWAEPDDREGGNSAMIDMFRNISRYYNLKSEEIKSINDVCPMDIILIKPLNFEGGPLETRFLHCGIMSKDRRVIHHMVGNLSNAMDFNQIWRDRFQYIFRLKV